MKTLLTVITFALTPAVALAQSSGNPADHLPAHIRHITDFGERADFSIAGRSVWFLSRQFGDVMEYELATGRIRCRSQHFKHHGFNRVMALSNGDLLLTGPDETFDATSKEARIKARHFAKMFVLDRSFTKPPTPLGVVAAEGPAVSRTRLRIAWTHHVEGEHRQTAISAGDLVYENGTPKLANTRLVLTTKDFPEGQRPKMIETQNFAGPDDGQLTLSAYLIEGGHNTESYLFDLETRKLTNFTNTPDDYEEVEGIFPDGKSTLVERNRSVGKPWPMVDAWRVWFDGSREPQRLTRFLDFPGYKAANYVVSDDGRLMAFQIGISGDEAGVGYGIFLYDFEKAGAAPAKSATRFERHATPLAQGIWAVDALDANGDGKRDFIAVGETKVWAILAPEWQQAELADVPGGRTIHAVALDADGDGDRDLALGRSASDWIRHRENIAAGKPSKEPLGEDWTVAWIENTGRTDAPWPLHRLDRELHGVHGVWLGDVNRDGRADLLANSFAGPHLESSLAWFAAPFAKDAPVGSLRRMITTGKAMGRPHYMDFADMNRDGRGDVLLGATAEGSFTWWEQPADLAQEWTRHVIAMEPGGSHPRAADLNGDGQLDVFGSTGHGVGVYWYAAPAWTRHVIDADLRDVHAFDVADLDGDGDLDAAGCSFSAKIVRWWENLGGGKFAPHDLDTTNEQQAYDLKIADLDGDGRRDILLAGRQSKNAVWYRQLPAPQ